MLYPLSYEGGDGPERGTKLSCSGPGPWVEGSSGPVGWSKLRFNQTKVSSAFLARRSHPVRRFGWLDIYAAAETAWFGGFH